MRKIKPALISFLISSIICIIGIILANIKMGDTFNSTGCGIALAIIFGVFALISLVVYISDI